MSTQLESWKLYAFKKGEKIPLGSNAAYTHETACALAERAYIRKYGKITKSVIFSAEQQTYKTNENENER